MDGRQERDSRYILEAIRPNPATGNPSESSVTSNPDRIPFEKACRRMARTDLVVDVVMAMAPFLIIVVLAFF